MEDLNLNLNESLRSVILNFDYRDDDTNWFDERSKFFFKGVGRMFYLVKPEETTFENVKDVPDYFAEAWPYFLLFILLENFLLWAERKPTMRLNDSITSLSHGLAHECAKMIFKAGEGYCYIYIHDKYRLLNLSWNNCTTWYAAAILMDFFYYWGHRASHEIHILWAQHQVHHSSEDFNTTVGIRQSVLQGFSSVFYLPMALFIPPSLFITHQHINLLYQFWIHTEVIRTLGPLEYIFNTPQHHRVHHGSNIWCLDKNYGGVLIIWDRIFGTFAEEQEGDEIIYGLVVNKPSFNPLHLQTFYTAYVFEQFKKMTDWKLKMCALFFGPSWRPGSPRLGLEEEKIKVGPREKYDVKLPMWCNIYIVVHFCMLVYGYHQFTTLYLSPTSIAFSVIYLMASLTFIGMILDDHPHVCILEVLRCMVLVTVIQNFEFANIDQNILLALEVIFLLSGLFWFLKSIKIIQFEPHEKAD